jgi:mono/diheme cytochrome c family protein
MRKSLIGIASVLWGALNVTTTFAQDTKQGQALYEGRCLDCHKEAPYGKGPPKAQSVESVRSMAKLWDSISAGTQWTPRDVDDVVMYLNQKFYRY